jgi:AAA+ ATPase superfamily predicted ATPase
MFIGRERELSSFEDKYSSKGSQLIAVYGRRRIGKSAFLKQFITKKRYAYYFEGVEGLDTSEQLDLFKRELARQTRDPLLNRLKLDTWTDVFEYITDSMLATKRAEKVIIVLDEFQWMAVGRTKLQALIKYFWDNCWKDKNLMLILCGSVSSYMVEKVVKSKALYGRLTAELCLQTLNLREVQKLIRPSRGILENVKYLLVFNGIPYYYTLLDLRHSFEKNLERLCLMPDSPLRRELERVFYSQFREPRIYEKIILELLKQSVTAEELARKLGMKSSGGFNRYLQNLEAAQFITKTQNVLKPTQVKKMRLRVSDPFIIFLFKFVVPNLKQIEAGTVSRPFAQFVEPSWLSWRGLAFERLLNNNASYVARILGIDESVEAWGPLVISKNKKMIAQYDLAFRRRGKILTICEIKFTDRPIGTEIIPEFERKLIVSEFGMVWTIEKVLICTEPPTKALTEANYFHQILTAKDLIG